VITRKDSGIKSLADLKGKKVAHTSPSSNSGNLAPRALLPDQGLVPEKDYSVSFSGKHDQSILGVVSGDYDAAPVASDVFERMVARGVVNADDISILYRSPKFPTSSFAYAHDLHPDLVHKIVGAFHTYRFPPDMQKAFKGADRFYPITYKADWDVIRTIAAATGTSYDRKGLTAMAEKEAAKKKK
jgi:phosphonate transport system substrate-binding protein